jgi:hypothetical protein
MADFALWIAACENSLWEAGTFEKAYATNRDNMIETVLEAIPLSEAVRSFMFDTGYWKGSASALLEELNRRDTFNNVRRDRHHWPQTPKGLSGRVMRIAPMMRKLGFSVKVGREPNGDRFVELNSNRPRTESPSVLPREEMPF